jgi:hypothetical protein
MFTGCVIVIVTKMIIMKSGKIGLKWKDRFSFEASASQQIAESVTATASPDLTGPEAASAGGEGEPDANSGLSLSPVEATESALDSANDSFLRMLRAENVFELDSAFADFTREERDADFDFWTTYYVERKQVMGVGGTSEELDALADANPTWISPLTSLLRKAVEAHDLDRANALIAQLLARRTKENSASILPSVLYAYFRMLSPERAVEFYREQSQIGLSSSEKAAMLSGLASNFDNLANVFAYRTLSEMALIADPARKGQSFQLGYSYGDQENMWALAFTRYGDVDTKSDQHTWSINNSGVLLQGIDNRVSIDFYEQAMAAGNALATSNLARLLINAGFLAAGERLLDSIADAQDAAEHIATTRAAALSGRRQMSKRFEEISNFAREETQRYNSVIARALRALDRGEAPINGVFGSTDRSFLVLLDAAGAGCRVTIGTLTYEGVLVSSPIGFDGFLSAKGQGILGGHLSLSLFIAGSRELVAVTWPNTKSTSDRIRITELPLIEEQITQIPPMPTIGELRA